MTYVIIPGEVVICNSAKKLKSPDLLNVMVAKNNLKRRQLLRDISIHLVLKTFSLSLFLVIHECQSFKADDNVELMSAMEVSIT